MQQPISNPPANQPINTREISLNECIEFTKKTWKDNGPFIIKSMLPPLIPIVLFHYAIASIPHFVSIIPIFGGIGSVALSFMLFPFYFFVGILVQTVVLGMNRPISQVALYGKEAIPADQTFFSMAKKNTFQLILVSLAISVATLAGVCVFIIPGIIVGIIAQPTGYLVATRGLSISDAARAGIDVIKANPIPILAYHGILTGVALALAIPIVLFFVLTSVVFGFISFIPNVITNLIFAALIPMVVLTIAPFFIFIFSTLYTKLIDGPAPALGHAPNQPQQPASDW